jgi:hypothetical protein
MLNAEPDTTSDILSLNGSHHTSIGPALPSSPSVAASAGPAPPVEVRLRRFVAERSRPLGNDARS